MLHIEKCTYVLSAKGQNVCIHETGTGCQNLYRMIWAMETSHSVRRRVTVSHWRMPTSKKVFFANLPNTNTNMKL